MPRQHVVVERWWWWRSRSGVVVGQGGGEEGERKQRRTRASMVSARGVCRKRWRGGGQDAVSCRTRQDERPKGARGGTHVVAAGDPHDVALELVAEGVSRDLLGHALLVEDATAVEQVRGLESARARRRRRCGQGERGRGGRTSCARHRSRWSSAARWQGWQSTTSCCRRREGKWVSATSRGEGGPGCCCAASSPVLRPPFVPCCLQNSSSRLTGPS